MLKIIKHHSPTRDDMFIVDYSISMRCILGDKGVDDDSGVFSFSDRDLLDMMTD